MWCDSLARRRLRLQRKANEWFFFFGRLVPTELIVEDGGRPEGGGGACVRAGGAGLACRA